MRAFLASMVIGFSGACAGPPSDDTRAMDAIESTVVLPPSARKLNEYARYYSQGPDDEIVAVFVLPALVERKKHVECEELNEDLSSSKPVPCVSSLVKPIEAGQRQWIADWRNLPWVHEQNCGDITVLYDRRRRLFKEVRCPGAAEEG